MNQVHRFCMEKLLSEVKTPAKKDLPARLPGLGKFIWKTMTEMSGGIFLRLKR